MKELKWVVFWGFWTLFWTFSRADSQVFCVFNESCILPCSFLVSSQTSIHWTRPAAEPSFIQFYLNGEKQLSGLDQNFGDRTSLFEDQIPSGNASLLLRGVKVQDQGRFKCNTGLKEENLSFINVTVDAPVKTIDLQQVEDRISCSSQGIYPEPELTWSTIPPSNVTLSSQTKIHRTEEQLYSISSCLVVSDEEPDLVYSCTIRTRRSIRTASSDRRTDSTAAGRGVGLVVVVILVAAFMGVVPCIFDKYYEKKCNKCCRATEEFPAQREEELHQLNVSSSEKKREAEGNTEGAEDEGDDSSLKNSLTPPTDLMRVKPSSEQETNSSTENEGLTEEEEGSRPSEIKQTEEERRD